MQKIVAIIKKKSITLLLLAVGYLLLTGILKWQAKPPPTSVWYLVGGLVGVYFLDIAEAFFLVTPSPFRSIVFAILFSIVSFFVVTSSGSLLATGLVLSTYLTLIVWQVSEWRLTGQLTNWYRMVAFPVSLPVQRWILVIFLAVFFIETFLFVR